MFRRLGAVWDRLEGFLGPSCPIFVPSCTWARQSHATRRAKPQGGRAKPKESRDEGIRTH
eukprot:4410914-Pyramimonas_sp.AAC.1